jgi:raffinose/stachyose/melibiose transport system permease protein
MIPIACGAALPFYYIIVNTFKTQEQTALSPLGLPSSLNFSNYESVFNNVPVWRSLGNTTYVTVLAVVAMLLIGSMAAYTFTVRPTRFNRRLSMVILLALAVPFQSTLVPLYEIMVKLHLVDSLSGLVIVYSGGAVFCCFLIQGYMSTLPFELVEASRIDGCGPLQTYLRVVLPLCRPVLVTVGVFQTMWVWNDFLVANTFLSSPQKDTIVLQVYNSVGQYSTDWPAFMTLTALSLVPITVFFMVMQRHIVSGLLAGAVKG